MAAHRRRGTLTRYRGWRAGSVASARPHRRVSAPRGRPVATRATWARAQPASACSWRGGDGSWRMPTLQRRLPGRRRAHDDRKPARRAGRGGGRAQAAHGVPGIHVRHGRQLPRRQSMRGTGRRARIPSNCSAAAAICAPGPRSIRSDTTDTSVRAAPDRACVRSAASLVLRRSVSCHASLVLLIRWSGPKLAVARLAVGHDATAAATVAGTDRGASATKIAKTSLTTTGTLAVAAHGGWLACESPTREGRSEYAIAGLPTGRPW